MPPAFIALEKHRAMICADFTVNRRLMVVNANAWDETGIGL
jgi:hypothetical protein